MSTTDQRPTANHERQPESLKPAETKPRIDLSFTQVAGGALAAMTAAFLGSRLSLAGTVAGAAVASIVAAVASNLYTASLRTTRDKVQTVFRGRTAGSGVPVTVEPSWDTVEPTADVPAASQAAAARVPARGHVQWRSIALGALAAFVLAAAVLTGLELASGHSLSGGKGTTISQVTEHQPAAKPSTEPTGAATASPTSSATDSPEPSASASSEPTATPSAAEPSPSASSTPSATPSDTPSASSTTAPDDGSGAQAGSAGQGAAGATG